ncbi:helix-turn-helix transcriptional regulator [Fimbriiglobus ruber]|uniref:HTH cro/C1-type domain-containing protein n=1 Tax=Fimbriiglobus ruber TaxID=1908690 RepID=A0A225DHQ5_9BACT|nr:helix-turn-helix transcriptional regulator [Fimbriiglobus ruber]OWK40982.1 hypothetical protein FRUB_04874 [Fimbriiglobus ruber]
MTTRQRHEIARQMGRRVRTGRVCKGLTPDGLAERAGLTRRYLGRIEAGVEQPTADDLVAIARALELPLWFVFDVPAARGGAGRKPAVHSGQRTLLGSPDDAG